MLHPYLLWRNPDWRYILNGHMGMQTSDNCIADELAKEAAEEAKSIPEDSQGQISRNLTGFPACDVFIFTITSRQCR